jgi:hypothetical protein
MICSVWAEPHENIIKKDVRNAVRRDTRVCAGRKQVTAENTYWFAFISVMEMCLGNGGHRCSDYSHA